MESCEQPKIRVVIRKRPLNKKEISRNEQDVVEVGEGQEVRVREHKLKVDLTKYIEEHTFKFDSAFSEEVSNTELYENCVRPIVQCAFLGAKVTCFAYGQTGSGKTYTMNGDLESGCPGIYYLGAEDIFALRNSSYEDLTVAVSFYEIYCGKLFDLLNNREQLQAREDGKQNVNIVGLTVKTIQNPAEFMETIAAGSAVRITSQNSTNADSSRSHAILQISLMHHNKKNKVLGKISFIDLAGCERGADTIDQSKQTKIDGAEINKSLLALKECIRALDLGKNHTPFRGSKLTMVLKDSFTGFCKTVMIGNVSPGSASCENTLNTLRYADRVKELKKGGNNQGESKDDQLARQLMLPRTQKNKQIIMKNEDDSDEEIIIKPEPSRSQQNSLIPQNKPTTAQPKKPKYIQQSRDEDDPSMKKKASNIAPVTCAIPNGMRKGVMNTQHDHQNTRSVAHSNVSMVSQKQPRGQPRNKSLANKINLRGAFSQQQMLKKIQNQQPTPAIQTERRNIHQNYSVANLHEKYREIMEESQKFKGNWGQNDQSSVNNSNKKITRYTKQNPNKENLNVGGKLKTEISEEGWVGREKDSEWEIIFGKFRNWGGHQDQFEEMSGNFEELVKLIMKEELELSEFHKKMLLNEEKCLSESVQLYNESQRHSKNNDQMLEYTSRLHSHLAGRIHSLVEFQTRIEMYQYHLKEHEACELRLLEASEAEASGLWDE